MKQEEQVAAHAPTDAVRQAFEQRRNTRGGRERLPEELRQAAVDLLEAYSVSKIASELKPKLLLISVALRPPRGIQSMPVRQLPDVGARQGCLCPRLTSDG